MGQSSSILDASQMGKVYWGTNGRNWNFNTAAATQDDLKFDSAYKLISMTRD
jgi:hypothetical protein